MKLHKPLSYYLGNFLIIFSILSLIYIYYPLLSIPFSKATLSEDSIYSLSIPKINANASIVINVNPWDESEYRSALSHGIAHAKGTVLPGETGTSFLFAHSSDMPWRITRYNTPFLLLNRLENGDEIILTKSDQTITYKVTDKKVVNPNQTEYLKYPTGGDLILQTCYPPGTELKRLLIFAQKA